MVHADDIKILDRGVHTVKKNKEFTLVVIRRLP